MSSDDEFEDTYEGIADEEAVEPLEVESAATIQATIRHGTKVPFYLRPKPKVYEPSAFGRRPKP